MRSTSIRSSRRAPVVVVLAAVASVVAIGVRLLTWSPAGPAGTSLAVLLVVVEAQALMWCLLAVPVLRRPAPPLPTGRPSPLTVTVWLTVGHDDRAMMGAAVRSAVELGDTVVLDGTTDPRVEHDVRAAGCRYRALDPATARRALDGLLASAADVVVAVSTPERFDRRAIANAVAVLARSPGTDAVVLAPVGTTERLDPDQVVVVRRTALIAAGGVPPSGELGAPLAVHLARRRRAVVHLPVRVRREADPVDELIGEADRRRRRLSWALGPRHLPARGRPENVAPHVGAVFDAVAPAGALVVAATPVLVAAGAIVAQPPMLLVTLLASTAAALTRAAASGASPALGTDVARSLVRAFVPSLRPGRSGRAGVVRDRARLVLAGLAGTQLAGVALAASRWFTGALPGATLIAVIAVSLLLAAGAGSLARQVLAGSVPLPAAWGSGRAPVRPERAVGWR